MEPKKLPDFCGKISGFCLFITRIKVVFTYVSADAHAFVSHVSGNQEERAAYSDGVR
jgi:hypothetical protein